jgi:hypothetical protein
MLKWKDIAKDFQATPDPALIEAAKRLKDQGNE